MSRTLTVSCSVARSIARQPRHSFDTWEWSPLGRQFQCMIPSATGRLKSASKNSCLLGRTPTLIVPPHGALPLAAARFTNVFECTESHTHQNARIWLQWCDQKFKKPRSILFFVVLHTSLCNGLASMSGFLLVGRTAGVV